MYRVDVRMPSVVSVQTSTSTTIATLTIPGVPGKRIGVTGYSIQYATAPDSFTTPTISTSGGTIYTISRTVNANTFAVFPYTVMAQYGLSVQLSATLTAAGVITLTLLYYIDS